MKYIDEAKLDESLKAVKHDPIGCVQLHHELREELFQAVDKVRSQMVGLPSEASLKAAIARSDNNDVIAAQESLYRILKLGKGEIPLEHKVQTPAPLTLGDLADGFAKLEGRDQRVSAIFLNVREYADIRKKRNKELEFELRPHLLKVGLMAALWGSLVITSSEVPSGTVWLAVDEKDLSPRGADLDTLISVGQGAVLLRDVVVDTPAGLFNPYGVYELAVTR